MGRQLLAATAPKGPEESRADLDTQMLRLL